MLAVAPPPADQPRHGEEHEQRTHTHNRDRVPRITEQADEQSGDA